MSKSNDGRTPREERGGNNGWRYSRAEEQLESLKRSGEQLSRAGTTLILVCVYLGLAAAATTHRDLVVGRTLVLPLLDVQLPVRGFYAVAPLLVLVLHLNLMIMEVLFQSKLRRFRNAEKKRLREPGEPDLTDSFGVSLLVRAILNRETGSWWLNGALRLMFLLLNLFAPVGVLLLLQAQFMPLHHPWIRWHVLVVAVGILSAAYLIPKILSPTNLYGDWFRLREQGRFPALQTIGRIIGVLTSVVIVIWLSFAWLTPMGTGDCDPPLPSPLGKWVWSKSWWPHWSDLRWPRRNLKLADNPGEFEAPISLVRQDLRCADFSGLDLSRADLRGSTLANASFERTILRGAHFSPASRKGGEPARPANLTGADFGHAVLTGANLENAVLIKAVFVDADLRSSRLNGANLQGSDLRGSRLSGASLREAILDHAVLAGATLVATDLSGASLHGANLADSTAMCALFRETRMDFSVLYGAGLAFADFTEASARGVDLRRANLGYVDGLVLENQSVAGAKVAGLCSDPVIRGALHPISYTRRTQSPTLSDLRELLWTVPSSEDLQTLVGTLDNETEGLEITKGQRVDLPGGLRNCRARIKHRIEGVSPKDEASEGDERTTMPCMWNEGIPQEAVTRKLNLFSREALVLHGVERDTFSIEAMGEFPDWREVYRGRGEALVASACADGDEMRHLIHRFIKKPFEVRGPLEWAVRASLNRRVRAALDNGARENSTCQALESKVVTELEELLTQTTSAPLPERWYSFTGAE